METGGGVGGGAVVFPKFIRLIVPSATSFRYKSRLIARRANSGEDRNEERLPAFLRHCALPGALYTVMRRLGA